MAEPDLDVLIGRLAVHSKVLSKAEVKEALHRWRTAASDQEFGPFLVAEGSIPPEVLQKLLLARERLLGRERTKTEAPEPSVAGSLEALDAQAAAEALEDTRPVLELARDAEPPPAPESPGPDDTQPVPIVAAELTDSATVPEIDPVDVEEIAEPVPAVPVPADAEPRGLLRTGPGVTLEDLLRQTRELGASDLHVHSGAPLKVRLHGRLLDASEIVGREAAEELVRQLLDDAENARLEENLQLDFAFEIPEVGRFRANAYRQQRGLDAVFRAIPPEPPTLAELGLPPSIERLASFHQGMVLLTGPAGCGKSSTMAAMVRRINERRPDHIITIEDPIEYVHRSRRCVVNQRQVGPHTESFSRALRAALREDPDVIAIGELRDLETISLALTAAETGHLVLGTLHTSSAIRTVNRLLGVFPPDQQAQIRTMVSESLRAVVSQRLLPRADGDGRVPALEVLENTKAVGNLIRERKTYQLVSVLQTGGAQGMCLLDASLAELVKTGAITKEAARREAEKPEAFA